jgi:hypothetical protein
MPIDWKRFTPCSHTPESNYDIQRADANARRDSSTDKICLASGLQILNAHRVFGGHGWTQGRVMTGLVDSPIAQYAVIEARRTEGPSERFVIAYPDEESLRELIAGPSIIACGFASREEAQVNVDTDFWAAAAWKQTPRDGAEKYQRGVLSAKWRLGAGFNLTQTGRIVRGFLQAAVAGAILIFYSRNAVSTVIRSFVVG